MSFVPVLQLGERSNPAQLTLMQRHRALALQSRQRAVQRLGKESKLIRSLAQAQAQTGDYLDWLVREVKPAALNMDDLDKTVQRLHATAPEAFRKLDNFEGLDKKNITRAYLEFQ